MSLPDVLKVTRQKVFMTQEDFSIEIHVSVETINRWENGKVKPNLQAMKKIKMFCDSNDLPFETIEEAWFDKAISE